MLDALAGEVTEALASADVRSILLKGPVTAKWLYADDPDARPYEDVDLLVAPSEHRRAEEVLLGLGFEAPANAVRLVDEFEYHSSAWHRREPGAPSDVHEPRSCFLHCGVVDLHHTLHFLEDIPSERVWQVVANQTERWELAGATVEVPGPAVRTLQVALHPTPEGPPDAQSWQDLRRAIAVVDRATWEAAATLARDFGADGAMGVGLRLVPEGVELAHRLGLPDAPPPSFLLKQAQAPPEIRSVARLTELPGLRRKIRFAVQKVFPPAAFLRQWSPLASRSRLGLVAAYGIRAASALARLPGGVRGWHRLRRSGNVLSAERHPVDRGGSSTEA